MACARLMLNAAAFAALESELVGALRACRTPGRARCSCRPARGVLMAGGPAKITADRGRTFDAVEPLAPTCGRADRPT